MNEKNSFFAEVYKKQGWKVMCCNAAPLPLFLLLFGTFFCL